MVVERYTEVNPAKKYTENLTVSRKPGKKERLSGLNVRKWLFT